MPDFGIRAGATNATIYVRLRDSTTGLAKTGIAWNDAGAVCSYTLPLAARAAITLATQTVTGAHSDGGFVEVDATNCKGLYRLDLTDAAVASGNYTVISIEFDGIIEESIHIPLLVEPLLSTVSAQVTTIASDTLAIEADTNELQGDWTNAGRLDAILDTIYSDTTVLVPAVSDVKSDLVVIEALVSDLDSALVLTDAVVDTIYSDTTVLEGRQVPTVLAGGTAQGGSASTIQLAAAEGFANDELNGNIVKIMSGTGAGQSRYILDYVGASDTATVDLDWTTNPDATSVYEVVEGPWGVWSATLTGATYNVASSAGRRLRNIQDFGIYDMASVWVDEAAGSSTGTTDGEDATVANRANDFDNAVTVAASVGLDRIHVQNANSITLTGALVGYTIWGGHYTLALGSQSIANSSFHQATVSGIGTGASTNFVDCVFAATTLAPTTLAYCGLGTGGTTFTLGSAGAYRMIRCYSDVAGAAAPVIDMNSLGAGTTLELRDWRGGVTLNNLTTNHTVTLDGIFGTITLNGADAAVEIRGFYKALTNNLTGSPSVTETGLEGDASAAISDVKSDLVVIEGLVSDLDSALVLTDAVVDTIYSDTTILEADWADAGRLDAILDIIASDTLAIEAAGAGTGLSSIATGTAQAGAAASITLAAALGFADNELIGSRCLLTGGTGAGQSRIIDGYTGATDVADVTPNWTTTPDATSTYEIQAADATAAYMRNSVINAANIANNAIASAQLATTAVQEIVDGVWDEAKASHLTAGTVGSAITIIQSDTTAIEASGGSLTVAQDSKLTKVTSDGVVMDAAITTIYSDTTLLVTKVSDLDSALVLTDAVVDTIYSDTTIIVPAVSDVESCLVVVKSDIAEVYSDTTLLVTAVSDVKSALVVVDTVVDNIYSDTTALSAGSNPPQIVGGWGFDGSSYFWNASLLVDGLIISSGVSAPAVVGVYGNNGETDLGYTVATAPGVQTKHSVGGSFTLSTLPTSGNPAYLEITLVYATVTYTARLYGWGR